MNPKARNPIGRLNSVESSESVLAPFAALGIAAAVAEVGKKERGIQVGIFTVAGFSERTPPAGFWGRMTTIFKRAKAVGSTRPVYFGELDMLTSSSTSGTLSIKASRIRADLSGRRRPFIPINMPGFWPIQSNDSRRTEAPFSSSSRFATIKTWSTQAL